jgi:methionyl-tRNA formyltransferase
MKLVFCGTPQFAVPTLERLISAGHDMALVVTQPDRPQGRGLALAASPIKQCAERHKIKIQQPEKIKNNAEFRTSVESINADAIIVVGYGRIVPAWMLSLPRHGNINLHGSLLPKYRGAAPIQWAIAEGETISGATTMRLNEGLDTGPILLQRELAIDPDETAITYNRRLSEVGAELMLETLGRLDNGSIASRPQDDRQASLAPILTKEDGLANFNWPARKIYNRFRGFQPWPGCYTFFRGKKLAITSAKPEAVEGKTAGELILDRERLFVVCGENTALELMEVRPEGKRKISAAEFVRGYRPQTAEKLGQ